MPVESDIAERLFELESRAAHQEETIDKLNEVVRDQWNAIDRRERIVRDCERRVAEVEEKQDAVPIQKPPHY